MNMRYGQVGRKEEAEFIRDWFRVMDKHGRATYQAPDGFKRLGNGAYRVAYLAKDSNVVYKVQWRATEQYQSNRSEYLNLRSMMLCKLPEEIRFPKYHLWELDTPGDEVAAMEYLPKLLQNFSTFGEGSRLWAARNTLCRVFPALWDSHGGNIAVDEKTGQIVPIDLGGYYRHGVRDYDY
jgi:hypothetical protein